jgi:hypothetical protein
VYSFFIKNILLLFLSLVFTLNVYSQTSNTVKLFEVFHTPGASQLTIKVNGSPSNLDKFFIMNLIGKTMKQIIYKLNDNEILVSDINNMPQGLYIVLARDKSGKLLSSVKIYL